MNQNISVLENKAKRALNNNELLDAHRYLLEILSIDRTHSNAFYLLSFIPFKSNNIDKSIELLKRALALEPNEPKYLIKIAKCYSLIGDSLKTHFTLNKITKPLELDSYQLDTLGVIYTFLGLHEKAYECFKDALKLNKRESNFYYNFGISNKFFGKYSEAKDAFKRALVIEPMHVRAYVSLLAIDKTNSQQHIPTIRQMIDKTTCKIEKLALAHSLASVYESSSDYESAFYAMAAAKKERLAELSYSFSKDQLMFTSLTQLFSKFDVNVHKGYVKESPIFIVGMPRTGTTLVERVLSNHSDVNGVGELHDFEMLLKKLANIDIRKIDHTKGIETLKDVDFEQLGQSYIKSIARITHNNGRLLNKLPLNALFVGFIVKALPKCKIICLERNPLDTIVSNYRNNFSPEYSYCNYSLDLLSTTKYYAEYRKLIEHWLNLYPKNMIKVRYEEFATTPEKVSKNIFEFCDLDWQSNSLNIKDNKSPVATASEQQVRSGIKRRYIGNWRNYSFKLKEIKKLLEKEHLL